MPPSRPKCKQDPCRFCGEQRLKRKAELEVDSPVRQVIADCILPAVDIFNPRVVDRISDSQNVEHFNGDKSVAVFCCTGRFPIVKQFT